MDKKELRNRMHGARKDAHNKCDKKEAQQRVVCFLEKMSEYTRAKNILSYASMKTEMPTDELNGRIMADGKTLCLPMTRKEEKEMEAGEVRDLKVLAKTDLGTLEPDIREAKIIEPQEMDIVIVPGLAFDEEGHRIGYGSGYYDRYLKRVRPDCLKIGIAFDEQIVKKIIHEEHDVKMDLIISEKKIYEIGKIRE